MPARKIKQKAFQQVQGIDKEPTISDVLTAINGFATHIESELSDLKQDVGGLKQDVGGLKQEIGTIKATMVTKDYLDDKLCDLRDDLTRLMFKEDVKLKSLVNTLHRRKAIPLAEKKRLFNMEPFAQIRQS